jgi:hypothetical protein
MTPQEITLLAVLLFLITVGISFFIRWRRKQADGNQPPEWDWYDIAELARTAVKDAEQFWLKEGLPKQARLEHAISILVQHTHSWPTTNPSPRPSSAKSSST